jgi:hypothetical protein
VIAPAWRFSLLSKSVDYDEKVTEADPDPPPGRSILVAGGHSGARVQSGAAPVHPGAVPPLFFREEHPTEDNMKKSLLAKIGAGFLMGSVLAVAPAGAADLYDSLQAFSYDMSLHRSMGSDPYDSMEPTAAGGSQGPVRTDMMKDRCLSQRRHLSGHLLRLDPVVRCEPAAWPDRRPRHQLTASPIVVPPRRLRAAFSWAMAAVAPVR